MAPTPRRARSRRRLALGATALLAVAGAAALAGCQKALFREQDPRTQFEVHDRMRGRAVPMSEPDVFGNPQPALRARLTAPG